MTKKYLCLLAITLGGCPAFEIPSPDGGLPENFGPQDNMQEQCFDGGVCGDYGDGPAQAGRGGGLADGAGGTAGSASVGDGGTPFDPGHPPPGGDLVTEFSMALDRLYMNLCACEQLSPEECGATYREETSCQLASIQANVDLARPWLECAVGALREQADCIGKAACDPDQLIACVAPNGDDQDPITAKCGPAPATIEEGDVRCGGEPVDSGFPCFDGSAQVPADLVCNGVSDCIDGSDEMVCEPDGDMYDCGDGEQIYSSWVCDGEADCENASDELECEGIEPGPGPEPAISCGDGTSVPLSWVCDGYPDCETGADEVDCREEP
jgi:hypothetical protein